MSEENVTPAQQPTPAGQGGADVACCGPGMAEMMKQCPCAAAMKNHPVIGIAVLSLMLLMFLISQVGGILGIIAFFRTL